MKRGAKIYACQDGKWSRRVEGEVIGTRNGHHIQVRFVYLDEVVTMWVRKRLAIRCAKRRGCVTWGKRPAGWEGWAAIDTFCPWFTIYKRKEVAS